MRAQGRLAFLLAGPLGLGFAGCSADPTKVEPPVDAPAASAEELIEHFAAAYRALDVDAYESLLAKEPAARAEFVFRTRRDAQTGDVEEWGSAEEMHIHQRMFDPSSTLQGQYPPVPGEYWTKSISLTLSQKTQFSERVDLYESPGNPNGLSPLRWKAMMAEYHADVLFYMQGVVLHVLTPQEFVVVQDLAKQPGQPGSFLLLSWSEKERVRAVGTSAEERGWDSVKGLFR